MQRADKVFGVGLLILITGVATQIIFLSIIGGFLTGLSIALLEGRD